MISEATAALDNVERYLFRLGGAMTNVPAAEREENVREIRAHILDSIKASDGSLQESVTAVLERLGSPEQLAASFERESSFVRVSRSFSPLVWLRTTARWALSGVQGFVAFVVALIGYSFGGAILLAGLLKPVLPRFIGLFISPHTFSLNRQGVAGERELIGVYFIPLALAVGSLLIFGTTLLLRWIGRRLRAARQYLRRGELSRLDARTC